MSVKVLDMRCHNSLDIHCVVFATEHMQSPELTNKHGAWPAYWLHSFDHTILCVLTTTLDCSSSRQSFQIFIHIIIYISSLVVCFQGYFWGLCLVIIDLERPNRLAPGRRKYVHRWLQWPPSLREKCTFPKGCLLLEVSKDEASPLAGKSML